MKRVNKKLILITIAIILILSTIFAIKTYASSGISWNLGDKVTIGHEYAPEQGNEIKIEQDLSLYCIQQRTNLDLNHINTYKVTHIIQIDGLDAKSGDTTVKNKKINAQIAYILSLGQGEMQYINGEYTATDAQRALWKKWTKWYTNVGYNFFTKKERENKIYKGTTVSMSPLEHDYTVDAEEYANNLKAAATLQGNSSISINNNGGAKYKLTYSGTLTNIEVTYRDGSKKTFANESGKKYDDLKIYSDSSLTQEISISDIKSEMTFYLKNMTEKNMSNIKITAKSNNVKVYSVKICTLRKISSAGSSQNLIHVEPSSETKTIENSIDISVKEASLSGNVWIDAKSTKSNTENNKMDSNENKLKDIPVILYKNDKKIRTTLTDSNGYYKFEHLNYADLQNMYVQFGYDNTKYLLVDTYVGDKDESSKVKETTMPVEKLEDANLTGIKGDYPGIATTDQTKGTLLDKNYFNFNDDNYEVTDVNMGLKEKENYDFNITEDVAYMKVVFGNYEYRYEYGKAATTSTTVPTVNEQNSIRTFTGKIYPSDVAYNSESNTETLKVYIIYKINITNTTNINIDSKYVEDRMYVESLTSKYDTERLIPSTDVSSKGLDDVAKDEIVSWKNNQYNGSIFSEGIRSNETKTTYVEYQLSDSYVKTVLNKELTYETIATSASTATASTFHEYWRADNVWTKGDNKYYNGHKLNSYTEPSTGADHYLHKTLTQEKTTGELCMKLALPEKERTLSGYVFEDKDANYVVGSNETEENSSLGNGMYDGDNVEAKVKTVKVELLDESGNVATLYQKGQNDKGYTTEPASKTYEAGAKFEFVGVIPGKYYIRFTYGDGTTITKTTDGNEVTTNVDVSDYKSTIVTDSATKAALQGTGSEEWYKSLAGDNYSTAVDDLTQRAEIHDVTYNPSNLTTNKRTTIDATTPLASITIEDTNEDYTVKDESGNVTNIDDTYYEYSGFNLGIITVPDTTITPGKQITNVKLTTQNGANIINQNPRETDSVYITALDKVTPGSKYTKIEMDNDLVYGSNVEVTYTVTVSNNSEINYNTEAYYNFGEIEEGQEAKVIATLKDYLDEKYEWDTVSIVETDSGVTIAKQEETSTNADGVTTTEKYEQISGFKALATGESQEISYTVSETAVPDSDDLLYQNNVEVKELQVNNLVTLTSGFTWENDKTVLTITPPTGINKSDKYIIGATIEILIICAGLIIIKKKLL